MRRAFLTGLLAAVFLCGTASADFDVSWSCMGDCAEGAPVTFDVTYTIDEDVDSVAFSRIALKDAVSDKVFAVMEEEREIAAAGGSHTWRLTTTVPEPNADSAFVFVPCATATFKTTKYGVVEETYHAWLGPGKQVTYGEYEEEDERDICASQTFAMQVAPSTGAYLPGTGGEAPAASGQQAPTGVDDSMLLVIVVVLCIVVLMIAVLAFTARKAR